MNDEVAAQQVVAAHREAGTFFSAAGVQSFVLSGGDGEPVVLVHGLPASSFLYRKVIPELASRGFRALSFDWPGLGLAERPTEFDYSIGGLAAWAGAAIDALGIERCHLVLHDAGGPVGFELVARAPDRIASLTILNTMVQLSSRPYPGEVLARLVSRAGGPMASPTVWRQMMYQVGVADRSALPMPEVLAWRDLALGDNGGATYLQIMRHVREGHDRGRIESVIDSRLVGYPVKLVWGGLDPMLTLKTFGFMALAATRLTSLDVVPARHFLQEDQAPAVAELIARNAAEA